MKYLLASLVLASFGCGTDTKKVVKVDPRPIVSWPRRPPIVQPGSGRQSGGTLTPGPGHSPRDPIKHACEIEEKEWCFPSHPEPTPFPDPEPTPEPEPEPEPIPEPIPEPQLPENIDRSGFYFLASKKWVFCDLVHNSFREVHNAWWDFIPDHADWCHRIGSFTLSSRGCRCRIR